MPHNDHYDQLTSSAGDGNVMSTLTRDIQQLLLSSNNITQLDSEELSRKKLTNLQKLHINANQIKRVQARAFHKIIGLVELDLSDNFIESLYDRIEQGDDNAANQSSVSKLDAASGADKQALGRETSFLSDLGKLRQLNLDSNRLTRLDANVFSKLAQLRQLYLSRLVHVSSCIYITLICPQD